MTSEFMLQLGNEILFTVAALAAPMMLSALVIGVLVGMFQAATSIQEMTLSFIPKLVVLVAALVIWGPQMLQTVLDFATRIITDIPHYIG